MLTGKCKETDSICKINEVQISLPQDSNATCSDLSTIDGKPFNISSTSDSSASDCQDWCTNVIFKDWNEEEEFAQPAVTTNIAGKEGCLCNWGGDYSPIVGCRTDDASSDANAIFKTRFTAAIVAAAVVVSVTSTEMAFF
jgi:hypothetical protein